MAKKGIMISVDEELNDRWTKVSKKWKESKSSMVEDFLLRIIPVMEKEEPKDMISEVMKMAGQGMQEMGDLLDGTKKK